MVNCDQGLDTDEGKFLFLIATKYTVDRSFVMNALAFQRLLSLNTLFPINPSFANSSTQSKLSINGQSADDADVNQAYSVAGEINAVTYSVPLSPEKAT